MKEMFYTIEGGGYSDKLFELFGKDRVEKELEELRKALAEAKKAQNPNTLDLFTIRSNISAGDMKDWYCESCGRFVLTDGTGMGE